MTDVFDVLADETRRDIVIFLAEAARHDSEMSVGELVDSLGITQPTVSKHLKVLREAGLVRVREDGQHRFYRVEAAPLGGVSSWLQRVQGKSEGLHGEPLVDLEVLGRATGSLVSDAMTLIRGTMGKFRG